MDNGATTRWFLGANSGTGFYSLYGDFAAGDGDFLWILKGGPGCGKSTFLKHIGAAAETKGLAVEYIKCSGDPDSLDGLYVPALKTGWADGTAPHTLDPRCFGATGAYVDLGAFCDTDATRRIEGDITALTRRYRAHYARAYDCLAAAAAVSARGGPAEAEECAAAIRRASAAAAREFPKKRKDTLPGRRVRRFLGGLTADGPVLLEDTLTALCSRVCTLDNRYGLAWPYLAEIERQALDRGLDVLSCPWYLDPALPEAVLIPALSLGFLAVGRGRAPELRPYRHIRLDALVDPARLRTQRARLRADAKLEDALLDAAQTSLAQASALHRELEALYNPHVDFAGIGREAERHIARLLK